jgi:hypothetical protein
LSGTKATAVRRPAAAAERADDGAAAVLAARDDRQMEEFRAAKHFNCTGREPGLYADVNTGCKVRCCECRVRKSASTTNGCMIFIKIYSTQS